MTPDERRELLARIARGEETETKVGREGPVECAPAIRDRLAALRLLAELDGELERARRKAAGEGEHDDDTAAMSPSELRKAALKDRQLVLMLSSQDNAVPEVGNG